MRLPLTIFTIIFILFLFPLLAQDAVSPEDALLAKKYKELYKNETGVILDKEVDIEFKIGKEGTPIVIQTERFTLMSLRLNNSMDFFVFYDDYSSVSKAKLRLKNDKSSPYLVTKCGDYESEEIFHSDAKFCNYKIGFSSVGEVKKFEYVKEFKDVKYFSSYYPSEDYAVVSEKVSVIVPMSIKADIKEINLPTVTVKKEDKFVDGKNVRLYYFENLQAMKHERFSAGQAYTYPHFLILTKSYTSSNTKVSLIESMDDQYKWYSSLTKEEEKTSTGELKTITDNLIKGKTSDIEKIKAIYYWVQDNVRYIAFENGIAGYKPETAVKVFQNKYGDCKGMANLTKAMLKIAGYDARLTWLGTSSIPNTHTAPFLSAHNHMICTLIYKDKKYFLDATEKFISMEDIAERIQGRDVIIEDGIKYLSERTPVKNCERNKLNIKQEFEIEGTTLVGKGLAEYNGERKVTVLNVLHNSKADKKKEAIESFVFGNNEDATIKEFELGDMNNREIPFNINYSSKINNQVSSFDNDLYVNLYQYKSFTNYKIEKDRYSNVDFGEKVSENIVVKLKIPKEYKVKTLPPAFNQVNSSFIFNVSYSQQNDYLIFNTTLSIPKGTISKEEFKTWNSTMESLNEVFNEPIILTKK